jgi:hypothetical protein
LSGVDALSLVGRPSKIGFLDVTKIGVKFGFDTFSKESTDVLK